MNFRLLECIKAFFVHFPKNLGLLAFPKIMAKFFCGGENYIFMFDITKVPGYNCRNMGED